MMLCHGQPAWKTVVVCAFLALVYVAFVIGVVFIVAPYVIVQTIAGKRNDQIQKGVKKITGRLKR